MRAKNMPAMPALFFFAIFLGGCAAPQSAPAATPVPGQASLFDINGAVFVHQPDNELWESAVEGFLLASGGQIFSQAGGAAGVNLPDGSELLLQADTLLTLALYNEAVEGLIASLDLFGGGLLILPGSAGLQVHTPSGEASARGAALLVRVNPATSETVFACFAGECEVGNTAGTVVLAQGQSATAGADKTIPPQVGEISEADYAYWESLQFARNGSEDESEPEATSDSRDLVVAEATSFAATQALSLTQTAIALIGLPSATPGGPLPTATATSIAGITQFSNPVGPSTGQLSKCMHVYIVDAYDPDGLQYVKVQHSLNPGFTSNLLTIKLTNEWDNVYAEPITYNTSKSPGTNTVYWRFFALDKKGNITYYPAGNPFTYQDSLECGSDVAYSNVVGPTGGQLNQCQNTYSINAHQNGDNLFFVKVQYAFNPNFNGLQEVSLGASGQTWSKTFTINTFANPGPDTVYWRFVGRTLCHGCGFFYYPVSGSFSYTDSLDCGGAPKTATPTRTPTPLNTVTPTHTRTATPSPTPGATNTATPPPSATPTTIPADTATNTPAPTPTPSETPGG
jgi:hypothetical protein